VDDSAETQRNEEPSFTKNVLPGIIWGSAFLWFILVLWGVVIDSRLMINIGKDVFGSITLILLLFVAIRVALRAFGRRSKVSSRRAQTLEQLWKLHQEGALSVEEYELEKRKILGSIQS
jgi:hypothetical protein